MAKTLDQQIKEAEAQANLAKAAGIANNKVTLSQTERTHVTTLKLGEEFEISWSPEGESVFEALVEVVKIGLEAKKKAPPVANMPGAKTA